MAEVTTGSRGKYGRRFNAISGENDGLGGSALELIPCAGTTCVNHLGHANADTIMSELRSRLGSP